jgi:hypothetical protein
MIKHKLTDAMESNDTETRLWKARFAAAKAAYEAGELRQCESLLFRCLEQAKPLKEHTFATNTCHVGLGALYVATDKLDKANNHLQKALNELSSHGDLALKELYGVALRFDAGRLQLSGQFTDAITQLRTAVKTLEDVGTEGAVQLAYTMSDLATMLAAQGELTESKELLFSAMELLENSLGQDNPEYIRANIIYNLCDMKDEGEFLAQVEDSIFKMQYQKGQKHPNILRALRWYLRKRHERGEEDKAAEAKSRFALHSETLG